MGICSLELSFWAFRFRWIQMQVMAKEWVDWGLVMSGTGIHWKKDKFRTTLMSQNTYKEDISTKTSWWNARDSSADVHLFFWVKQIKQLHDRQKVCQGILLNASRNELQQDPHQVVPPFIEPSSCKLKRKKSRTQHNYNLSSMEIQQASYVTSFKKI